MPWIAERASELDWARLDVLMRQAVAEARRRICAKPRRVLLLPPDVTRMHSGSGRLTEIVYRLLADEADVHVIPTLGQHVPHTSEVNRRMFGSIPNDRIHAHDWAAGCVEVGEIPAEVVNKSTGGIADWPIPVFLNRMLVDEPWDLVINVGHVVPHEVLGFANHNKNYFIGLGGKPTICAAHMAAACYGIENNLGRLITPLRACFNWAEDKYLGRLPDLYIQVVLSVATSGSPAKSRDRSESAGGQPAATLRHSGLYVGDDLETYLAAARQSREENITLFDEPVKKIVCVMQGDEFHSTWVANKAVYRTRMALADGGELVIIAPGLVRFGEQPAVNALIRKHGYCGTPRIMEAYKRDSGVVEQGSGGGRVEDNRANALRLHSSAPPLLPSLHDLAHAAAHLIHGSSEGRFRITYAPGHLSPADIEAVRYEFLDIQSALTRYRPENCQPGWNSTADGEQFYFIPTPSAGLWASRERMDDRK